MNIQTLHSDLIIIELSILLTIGFGAFLLKLPKRDIYTNFRKALRCYGSIVLLWSLSLSTLAILKWQDIDPLISRAIIISASYIILRLLAMALCHLLKIKIPSKISTILTRWMMVNTTLILFAFHIGEEWARVAIHLLNVLAAIDAIAFGIHFHRVYLSRLDDLDNYYSEDMNIYLKWMQKEAICFVAWLLVGYLSDPFGLPPYTLHSLMGFLILVRLIYCFRGYLADLHKIKHALRGESVKVKNVVYPTKEEGVWDNISVIQRVGKMVISQRGGEELAGVDSDSHLSRIEPYVNEWIENRGYLEPMINIESLALEFGTNRAYLSSYINKRHGVNFRNWIAGLRVEYSKQLLIEQQHLTIAQIAQMICYTQSSYSTIFKKHYGVSVSQWRTAALNG